MVDQNGFTDFPEGFRDLEGWKLAMPDARLDLKPAALDSVVLIASLPRSGGNLVCEDLRKTCLVGVPMEYLNAASIVGIKGGVTMEEINATRWKLPSSTIRFQLWRIARRIGFAQIWTRTHRFSKRAVRNYLGEVARTRTTPNGVFSMKIHWDQWNSKFLELNLSTDLWHVPVHWIRIVRSDDVAQAISFVIADQTDAWVGTTASLPSATYDEDAIKARLAVIEEYNAGWDSYFSSTGIKPYEIKYETYIEDRSRAVSEVLAWLGLEQADLELGSNIRQASAQNQEWHERFLASNPEYTAG
jgi:LPS sulfotransferase NodH